MEDAGLMVLRFHNSLETDCQVFMKYLGTNLNTLNNVLTTLLTSSVERLHEHLYLKECI